MTVRRIVVRIDLMVLDAGVAGGCSAAEAAEVLRAALRADLAAAETTAAPAGERAGGPPSGRLSVTAEDSGLDAVARAASLAVGRVVAHTVASGRPPRDADMGNAETRGIETQGTRTRGTQTRGSGGSGGETG
ncbi:hypothetical protein [Streptomyces herbicida]|uniref:hypothetical protein n=1 Tax=Streptomyces herbicida TaxID=3065675 RepID=UPI00292EB98F|nr:hypothetical protein [Streptomyces sp. NEAU-HV9]